MTETIIDWDGVQLPSALRQLPPGQYLVQPVTDLELTPEEEAGLHEAIASLDRGEGIPAEEVFEELRRDLAAR
jgi:hypothetical protein